MSSPGPLASPPPTSDQHDPNSATQYQLRIAAMILTGVNIASSLSLCARICWDAFLTRTASRDLEKAGLITAPRWWELFSGKELYPLVFGIGVLAQGVMLAVVESQGLDGFQVVMQCQIWADIAWMALWIPAYITLIFAADTALRAIVCTRFESRSKGRVCMMLGGVVVLLAVTFVPAVLRAWTGDNDQPGCTGEFTMLVDNFADLAVGILGALVVFTTVLAMIVYINLATKTGIDLENRMAASRELCFTAACLVQWVLLIPHFAVGITDRSDDALSFMAAVVVNISGITASALHLYLRATNTFVAGPSGQTIESYRRRNIGGMDRLPSEDQYRPPAPPKENRELDEIHVDVTHDHLVAPSPNFSDRSRFSSSTVGASNFHRLGEEISLMMSNLLSASSNSSSSRHGSPTPTPPPAESYRTSPLPSLRPSPHGPSNLQHVRSESELSVFNSAAIINKEITPPRNSPTPSLRPLTRAPSRPSRSGVPPLNVAREQNLGNSIRREELLKEIQSYTRTDSARSLFESVQMQSSKLGLPAGGRAGSPAGRF